MDHKTLLKASDQGIITKEQVDLLMNFDINDSDYEDHSEEQLRFIRSFGDIFITLGIVFVSIAAAQFEYQTVFKIIPIIVLIATTEWLVRVRRLALPGIALLISTLYFASQFSPLTKQILFPNGNNSLIAQFDLAELIILTVVALLFYWRYRMPFTLLPIALGIIGTITSLMNIDIRQVQYLIIIYGLIVFAVAMWFDSRDTKRKTRLSDAAFWLHLLAAPLVVHGVMVNLLVEAHSLPYRELLIILFFSGFFLIAMYVDRRAILVSSISYAIYAIVELAKNNQIHIENMTLVIFVGFGIFIIVFGVYWYKIRAVIFGKFNNSKLSKYVPIIIR